MALVRIIQISLLGVAGCALGFATNRIGAAQFYVSMRLVEVFVVLFCFLVPVATRMQVCRGTEQVSGFQRLAFGIGFQWTLALFSATLIVTDRPGGIVMFGAATLLGPLGYALALRSRLPTLTSVHYNNLTFIGQPVLLIWLAIAHPDRVAGIPAAMIMLIGALSAGPIAKATFTMRKVPDCELFQMAERNRETSAIRLMTVVTLAAYFLFVGVLFLAGTIL